MERDNFIVKFSGRLAFVHKVYGLDVNWDIASVLTNEQPISQLTYDQNKFFATL
jgi:hypothetical protein